MIGYISFGPQGAPGADAWDTFQTLATSCLRTIGRIVDWIGEWTEEPTGNALRDREGITPNHIDMR